MTRVLAVVALLLLAIAAPARAADETPPDISSATVTPTSLPKEGGTVAIVAMVTDDVGVEQVYVEANGSDGSFLYVALEHKTGAKYKGKLDLPGNPTEEERSYSINVIAADAAQNYSEPRSAGEVSVAATPAQDPFPWVSDPTVTPSTLPSGGGDVTIGAIATDNRSVSEVYAAITGPNGFSAAVPMDATSDVHFEGVFAAPPNAGTTPNVYSVIIYASDDIGQQDSVDGGTITVNPEPGQLKAYLVDGSFGQVQVGQVAYRRIKVRNLGRVGGPPVQVTAVRVGSSAFSIESPMTIRVKPGETRYFLVRFAPTAPGQATADVGLYRNDTAQPGLSVRLAGRGIAP